MGSFDIASCDVKRCLCLFLLLSTLSFQLSTGQTTGARSGIRNGILQTNLNAGGFTITGLPASFFDLIAPSQTGHSGQFLTTNGTASSWATVTATGTVTSFSSGNLSPLFTTAVTNSTTTPALAFTLSNAAAHTFLGNNTGSTGAPAYVQPAFTDISGQVTNSMLAGSIDDTKLLTIATAGKVSDSALSSNVAFENVANVFTTLQTIDLGSIGAAALDGFVMRNDTPGTALVPLQNSPLIVFEAHGWSGAVDHKWEMNEKFVTQASGSRSKFSWEFAKDDGGYTEELYFDNSGNFGATGYVDSGFAFRTTGGGQFSEVNATFNSPNALISNVDTTTPLFFGSNNTTVNAWRFRDLGLTSGNFFEGMVNTSGFTGSYLKFGRSGDGVTFTTTIFEVTAIGDLTTAGRINATALHTTAVTFINAVTSPAEGTMQAFTDSSTTTWGAVISGGGVNHVLGYYNGTNWTCMGK